jgi:hypothetical protein
MHLPHDAPVRLDEEGHDPPGPCLAVQGADVLAKRHVPADPVWRGRLPLPHVAGVVAAHSFPLGAVGVLQRAQHKVRLQPVFGHEGDGPRLDGALSHRWSPPRIIGGRHH